MTGNVLKPWPWKTALCFLVLCVAVLGRNLEFSGYVHPDEPNKVNQITQGHYNFNHPLLMLHSVKVYAGIAGVSSDYERVISAGRWSSVLFSSFALALLVLITGRLHGLMAGAAAGIFLLTTPLFFELAHYFKEDPALLFGLSLSVLSIQLYVEKPNEWRAAFLGAAAGIAASGKYAGLLILPFSLYAVTRGKHLRHFLTFATYLALAFILINLPMLASPEIWKSRVDVEVSRLQAAGVANPRQVPHGAYFAVFRKYATPITLALMALYGWSFYGRRGRLATGEWVLVLVPLGYLVVLSFIPTKSERYLLPAIAFGCCVAAAGLVPVLSWKFGRAIAIGLVALSAAWQASDLYAEDCAFASRRHEEVLEFLRISLPPSSVVLLDNYNGLPPAKYDTPKIMQRYLHPGETLQSMRKNSITHILVSPKRYPMFRPDSRRASGMSQQDDRKMTQLYEAIFNECRLVHEWPEGTNARLNPEFFLYELPAISEQADTN